MPLPTHMCRSQFIISAKMSMIHQLMQECFRHGAKLVLIINYHKYLFPAMTILEGLMVLQQKPLLDYDIVPRSAVRLRANPMELIAGPYGVTRRQGVKAQLIYIQLTENMFESICITQGSSRQCRNSSMWQKCQFHNDTMKASVKISILSAT